MMGYERKTSGIPFNKDDITRVILAPSDPSAFLDVQKLDFMPESISAVEKKGLEYRKKGVVLRNVAL